MVQLFTQTKVIAHNSRWYSQNTMGSLPAVSKNKLQRFQKYLSIALSCSPMLWRPEDTGLKSKVLDILASKHTLVMPSLESLGLWPHMSINQCGLWAVRNTPEDKGREQDSVAFVTSRGQHERDIFYLFNSALKYNL